eukprot:409264-Alexandrium_andersonii.AAC.1
MVQALGDLTPPPVASPPGRAALVLGESSAGGGGRGRGRVRAAPHADASSGRAAADCPPAP